MKEIRTHQWFTLIKYWVYMRVIWLYLLPRVRPFSSVRLLIWSKQRFQLAFQNWFQVHLNGNLISVDNGNQTFSSFEIMVCTFSTRNSNKHIQNSLKATITLKNHLGIYVIPKVQNKQVSKHSSMRKICCNKRLTPFRIQDKIRE